MMGVAWTESLESAALADATIAITLENEIIELEKMLTEIEMAEAVSAVTATAVSASITSGDDDENDTNQTTTSPVISSSSSIVLQEQLAILRVRVLLLRNAKTADIVSSPAPTSIIATLRAEASRGVALFTVASGTQTFLPPVHFSHLSTLPNVAPVPEWSDSTFARSSSLAQSVAYKFIPSLLRKRMISSTSSSSSCDLSAPPHLFAPDALWTSDVKHTSVVPCGVPVVETPYGLFSMSRDTSSSSLSGGSKQNIDWAFGPLTIPSPSLQTPLAASQPETSLSYSLSSLESSGELSLRPAVVAIHILSASYDLAALIVAADSSNGGTLINVGNNNNNNTSSSSSNVAGGGGGGGIGNGSGSGNGIGSGGNATNISPTAVSLSALSTVRVPHVNTILTVDAIGHIERFRVNSAPSHSIERVTSHVASAATAVCDTAAATTTSSSSSIWPRPHGATQRLVPHVVLRLTRDSPVPETLVASPGAAPGLPRVPLRNYIYDDNRGQRENGGGGG